MRAALLGPLVRLRPQAKNYEIAIEQRAFSLYTRFTKSLISSHGQ